MAFEIQKSRIVISSLYLGHGKEAQEIIDCIEDRLNSSSVQVTILFDYLRGTRGPIAETSVGLLLKLIEKYPKQFNLFLYHTPRLNGYWKQLLPSRINEIVGVQHIKAYVFDDDILISGANLYQTYFVNRQDRYLLLTKQSSLCSYFVELIETICSFSFVVKSKQTSKSLKWSRDLTELVSMELDSDVHFIPWLHPAPFAQLGHDRLLQFLQKYNGDFRDQFRPWRHEHHHSTHRQANDASQKHNGDQNTNESVISTNSASVPTTWKTPSIPTTWITPSIQSAPHNIRQDEYIVRFFLQNVPANGSLYVTSPYLNFTPLYEDLLLNNCAKLLSTINIITASPQANGFYTATDISRFIPSAYVHVERALFDTIKRRQHWNIQIVEYDRANWTYHAKGIWCMPTSSSSSTTPPKTPTQATPSPDFLVTFIGSPNLSQRSSERDLEAQLMIESTDPKVIQKFKNELNSITNNCSIVTKETFNESDHHVPLFVRHFAKHMIDFL